jgi:hypothetical protein
MFGSCEFAGQSLNLFSKSLNKKIRKVNHLICAQMIGLADG